MVAITAPANPSVATREVAALIEERTIILDVDYRKERCTDAQEQHGCGVRVVSSKGST